MVQGWNSIVGDETKILPPETSTAATINVNQISSKNHEKLAYLESNNEDT